MGGAKKIGCALVALLAMFVGLVVSVGAGIFLLFGGGIATQEGSSTFCSIQLVPEGSEISLPFASAIVESSTITRTGLNLASIATFAAYTQSGLRLLSTAGSKDVDRAGYFGLPKNAFPGTKARVWGTSHDPRFQISDSSIAFLGSLETILRDGGDGSSYETGDTIRAALTAVGIETPPNPARLYSRVKNADFAAVIENPFAPQLYTVLSNAVIGFAPDGVGGPSGDPVRVKFAPAKKFFEPLLEARSSVAAEGKTGFILSDNSFVELVDDFAEAGFGVNVGAGRVASVPVLQQELVKPRMQTAGAWVINLGSYNEPTDAAAVSAWVSVIAATRGSKQVYWVTPYRSSKVLNPYPEGFKPRVDADGNVVLGVDNKPELVADLGWKKYVPNPLPSLKPLADAIRVEAGKYDWLHALNWDSFVGDSGESVWFADDPRGSKVSGDGVDAALAFVTLALQGDMTPPDEIYGGCDDRLSEPAGAVDYLQVTIRGRPTIDLLPGSTSVILDGVTQNIPTQFILTGVNGLGTNITQAISLNLVIAPNGYSFKGRLYAPGSTVPGGGPVVLGANSKNVSLDRKQANEDGIHGIKVSVLPGGGLEINFTPPDIQGVVKLDGPSGKFQDGPPVPNAIQWVPKMQRRVLNAMQDPPCQDNRPGKYLVGTPYDQFGCKSLCAQLVAKVNGQPHGFYKPGADTWARSMFFAIRDTTTVDRGLVGSGREFTPPVGALLFWDFGPQEAGHVAIYVGNGGQLVSNIADNFGVVGPRVVQMPAQKMVDSYEGYVGWTLPPKHWQK